MNNYQSNPGDMLEMDKEKNVLVVISHLTNNLGLMVLMPMKKAPSNLRKAYPGFIFCTPLLSTCFMAYAAAPKPDLV